MSLFHSGRRFTRNFAPLHCHIARLSNFWIFVLEWEAVGVLLLAEVVAEDVGHSVDGATDDL